MRVKVKQLKRLIKEGNLPQLDGLVNKIKHELPLAMSRRDNKPIELDGLMWVLGVPESEKEVFKHLLTDPENTGGIQYKMDLNPEDSLTWVSSEPSSSSLEDPTDPLVLDTREEGVPPGESLHVDFEGEMGKYDPDRVGGIKNFDHHAEKGDWHFPKGEAPGHRPNLEDGYVAPEPKPVRKSWDEQSQEERDADMEEEDAFLKQFHAGRGGTHNESRKPQTITVKQLKEYISKEVAKVLKASVKTNAKK